MPAVCQVTGKRTVSGNKISHAHNVSKRTFKPNLRWKRFWHVGERRWIRLRISTEGIRLVEKLGFERVFEMVRARGEKVRGG